jgi:hypothetical protein
MKRREFIVGAATALGLGLPILGRSEVKPCPPSTVDIAGGTAKSIVCGEAATALPDWLPPRGEIADISLNTLHSQAPILGGTQTNPSGVMDAWCGMTYAESLGAMGSMVLYGGGHADYLYNEVYRYDIATRLWSRIVEPTYPIYIGPDRYYVDATYGEYYTSSAGTSVHVGKPSADHTYGHTLWLPPGSLGSDPAGYYFSAGVDTHVPIASRGSAWPHYVPLSNPTWMRGGAAFGGPPAFGPALYDSARNRVVLMSGFDFNQKLWLFDCATQTASSLSIGSPGTRSYYGTGAYDSDADLYMCASANFAGDIQGARLQLVNPTSGAMKYATISGDSIVGLGVGGWEWVQSWGAWVYYPGSGSVVFKLQKPSDPWRGVWTMSKREMVGEARAKSAAPHFTRFRYVPVLDCFIWASTTRNPVQAFNVIRD